MSLNDPVAVHLDVIARLLESRGYPIEVDYVSATNFQQIVADNSSDFAGITVKILYNGSEISQAKWIRSVQ